MLGDGERKEKKDGGDAKGLEVLVGDVRGRL